MQTESQTLAPLSTHPVHLTLDLVRPVISAAVTEAHTTVEIKEDPMQLSLRLPDFPSLTRLASKVIVAVSQGPRREQLTLFALRPPPNLRATALLVEPTVERIDLTLLLKDVRTLVSLRFRDSTDMHRFAAALAALACGQELNYQS